ncbi:MAG: translocation/assembly module TamB [Saprospiraceae bacterium]|nr:translocation/assembly module TamB [Saprospiraceae bacterium]
MNDQNSPTEAPIQRITIGRRILRFFFGLIFLLLVFVSVIISIVNLPYVQRKGVELLSDRISKTTGTRFEIGSFQLTWRGDLDMRDVYIESLEGDSLLNADILGSHILRDLPGLIQGHMSITDIKIEGSTLHLKRYADGSDNIQRLIRRLFPPKKAAGGSFDLDIRRVRLNDFRYIETDSISGKFISVNSGKADIYVRCVSISPLDFEFYNALSDGARVEVRTFLATEPDERSQPSTSGPPRVKAPFSFWFDKVNLENATFILNNDHRSPTRTKVADEIDYNHLVVNDLNIQLRQFAFNEQHTYSGSIIKSSLRESSGFELTNMSADQIVVNRTSATFNGIRLETRSSTIGDTLVLRYSNYPDFLDFNNRVILAGQFSDSRIGIGDLFYFAPALKSLAFFQKNKSLSIYLDGFLGSRVNNLKGRDIRLRMGDHFQFKGSFGSRNLAVRHEESLNLKLEELSTDVKTLREIIPGFAPPANFNKLGKLHFKGRFDGFLVDFVSYGELKTDLGEAFLDMRMNLKDGLENAAYSGELGLRKFDLGKWTSNPQFGLVSFHSNVKNGRGLTLEKVRADLQANIESLAFRDYVYQNLKIKGDLTKDRFNGQFDIRDRNIDLIFEGFIRYRDSLPSFDFKAIINHLDLQALNFIENPVSISGIVDLNLKGRDINSLIGYARALQVDLDQPNDRKLHADSLILRLQGEPGPNRQLAIESDLLEAHLKGDFQILELSDVIGTRISTHFPELAHRLGLHYDSQKVLQTQRFTFDLIAKKMHAFMQAFDAKAPNLDGTFASGMIDYPAGKALLQATIPQLVFQGVELGNLNVDFKGDHIQTSTSIRIDSFMTEGRVLHKIRLASDRTSGPYDFRLAIDDQYPFGTDLKGNFAVDSTGYRIHLNNDSLVFTNRVWEISEGNQLQFDSAQLAIRDLRFTSDGRTVEVKDYRNRGLILHLQALEVAMLNRVLNYDKVKFDGLIDVDLLIRNIFQFKDFALLARSDSLLVNQDNFGSMIAYGSMATLKSPMEYTFELGQKNERISIEGYWFGNEHKDQGGGVDLRFTTANFPIKIAEYFLSNGITDTKGTFNADLHLTGPLYKPELAGFVDIADLYTTIAYLGTRYHVDKGRVLADSYMFDASGVVLRDVLNNEARVTGGMIHDHFRNWGLRCSIESDRMLALDTRKQDNAYYYGTGIGKMKVDFSGSLKATNIYVNAVTARGSSLSIPVNTSSTGAELQFVEFVSLTDTLQNKENGTKGLSGLQFDMDLVLTEEALVQIIFDERAGDILSGYGRGNIRLEVPRSGSMRMYGDYNIERGEYLFTFQNLVNKSFQVERGGTILWSGDPFEAQINLRANYAIASTPPYNLITEYLVTSGSSTTQAARNPTEVNLVMLLTGKLLEPVINFDLSFPQLVGEIRSLVETKMQTLRRDPNEMNWQVFGLIMSNNFLPSGLTQQGTQYVAGINTVSELISNQFSRYMTAMLSELVADVGIISGIDFDAGFSINQSDLNINQFTDAFSNTDFHLSQRVNFYDDRLSLAVKGNILNTTGLETTRTLMVGGDFQIEYALTEDRRLKVRVYQRSEPTILGNRRFKTGLGFSFRQEFD